MSKKRTKEKEVLSKRQQRREELRKKERQQRILIIAAVVVVAGLIIGLIALPALKKPGTPQINFTEVTPVSYATANGTTLGDPNSKVVIDVFEDFQCSACAVYTEQIEPRVLSEIVEAGKAYYVFHQYSFEPDADPTLQESDNAAMASECAAEQNRFWDYKNILFVNQTSVEGQYSDERLETFAESLDLDMDQFLACYKERRYQNKLDEGYNLAQQVGVKGTPSFYINGVNVSPGKVPSFEDILQAVEEALASGSN